MPKARRLSPKTVEAYRISLECFLTYLSDCVEVQRAHVGFEESDRGHLKAWVAWMADDRHYATQDRLAAAHRRQSVLGLLLP